LQEDPGDMQASEFRPAAVSADAPADGQWRRQTDNHGHRRALVPPDAITGAPETAVTVLRERAEVAEQRADDAVTRAERTLGKLVVVQAKLAEAEDRAGDAERDARAAWGCVSVNFNDLSKPSPMARGSLRHFCWPSRRTAAEPAPRSRPPGHR
jgi:hypothetical protein